MRRSLAVFKVPPRVVLAQATLFEVVPVAAETPTELVHSALVLPVNPTHSQVQALFRAAAVSVRVWAATARDSRVFTVCFCFSPVRCCQPSQSVRVFAPASTLHSLVDASVPADSPVLPPSSEDLVEQDCTDTSLALARADAAAWPLADVAAAAAAAHGAGDGAGSAHAPVLPGQGCDVAEMQADAQRAADVSAAQTLASAESSAVALTAHSGATAPAAALVAGGAGQGGAHTPPGLTCVSLVSAGHLFGSPGASPTDHVAYPASDDDWALLRAAEAADVDAMVAALSSTAVAHVRHPSHGASALHLVCGGYGDDASIVRAMDVLLDAGVALDCLSGNGATPLHFAAGSGNLSAVRRLLELGANPLARTYTWRRQVFGKGSGQTPLHWAAESNNADVVRELTAASGLAAVSRDERGVTPSGCAEAAGHSDLAADLHGVEQEPYVCVDVRLAESRMRAVVAPE